MSFWDRLVEQLRTLGEDIVEWAILIAIALVVLLIGRFILKWVRTIIERVLGADWLKGVWDRSGVTRALEPSGQSAATITAAVIYAYLMVVLWLIVVRILHLDTIEVLLVRLLAWVPLLILAAIVVIIAAAVASWTADLVRPFATDKGVPWLTWLIHIAIVIFGVLFAFEILDITFAEDLTKIVVGALGIALAIAFGVGGIDAAKLWWAKYGTPGSAKGGSTGGSSDYRQETRHTDH
jgi:Mechanosensitive ion channel, conserved TM helix